MTYFPLRSIAPSEITSGVLGTLIPSDTIGPIPSASDTIVLDNTIRLEASESSVDNYYVDFDLVLVKTLVSGKDYYQRRRIIAYNGTTKVATVDRSWDIGKEPDVGDTYTIDLSRKDTRVSINPAMQVFDYITSERYGRNLNPETDFLLHTVKDTALKCDAKSDVSLKFSAPFSLQSGDSYSLTESGQLIWEGTVRFDTSSSEYATFTNCLGKITNKWNSWKSFSIGQIVYNLDNYYKVTSAGTKSSPPVHVSGTTDGLEYITSLTLIKVTGAGPASVSLGLTSNPVVGLNANGELISGYSLYDADSINYWRHLGWDEHSQSSATLYQTNFTIDTSSPMFDNINMMFEHFNGIFTYAQGKYVFSLEEVESSYIEITEDDIIGKISLADQGSTKSFNSVAVSYTDPANNFQSKNISLFNDSFLAQDRNVNKNGNITVVCCTNYYNVRLLADSYLKKSRRDASIKMTLFPEFISLVPGSVIGVTYPRFRWFNRPFRVNSITINPDNTIDIVANEYDDSFYSLTNMNKTPGTGNRSAISNKTLNAPTDLKATNSVDNNELKDGILLSWTNATNLTSATDIEIQSTDNGQSNMTVTDILNDDELIFSAPHNLNIGSKIRSKTAGNGIIIATTYFVESVINSTTIRVSTNPGAVGLLLTNGSGLSIDFDSFFLVGTLGYP